MSTTTHLGGHELPLPESGLGEWRTATCRESTSTLDGISGSQHIWTGRTVAGLDGFLYRVWGNPTVPVVADLFKSTDGCEHAVFVVTTPTEGAAP